MSAPLIKFHLLPRGYTEETDQDIQRQDRDELIPVFPKSELLETVRDLSPVEPSLREPLTPFRFSAGRSIESLDEVAPDTRLYKPSSIGWGRAPFVRPENNQFVVSASAIWWTTGFTKLIVLDEGEEIDESNLQVDINGIRISNDYQVIGQLLVSAYVTETDPSLRTQWALKGDNLYTGNNRSFNRFLIRIDGGDLQGASPVEVSAGVTPYFETETPATVVIATYANSVSKSRHWIAEDNNWVTGHYLMNPDIFVGEVDYPGDQFVSEDEIPQEPGWLPNFRDTETYQLDARNGMVQFAEVIDPELIDVTNIGGSVVKANYAHFAGVEHVEGMDLTYQGFINGRHLFERQVNLSTSTRIRSLNRGSGLSNAPAVVDQNTTLGALGDGTVWLNGVTNFNITTRDETQYSISLDLDGDSIVQNFVFGISIQTSGNVSVTFGSGRLSLVDSTTGPGSFTVTDSGNANISRLGLNLSVTSNTINGTIVAPVSDLRVIKSDGSEYTVDFSGFNTVQDILDASGSDVVFDINENSIRVTDESSGSGDLIIRDGYARNASGARDLGVIGESSSGSFTGTQINFPETAFPDSHNKRLLERSNSRNPKNVYANDRIAPEVRSRTTPEVLTIKF